PPSPVPGKACLGNGSGCRRLHISKRTLQYLRNSGKLPYSTRGNKCYYKPEDVRALFDKNLTAQCR
ncbi:helix-turn-helix domain-containing protein, partial [uncultured Parabacteroides sp.]|uniref:helix-turn-helix domain-containing protein n=1 Tax=uncultured Parabacteroides sp. TaxID=512312 RepID=UPI002676DC2C